MLEISKSVELGKISKGKYLKTHCKILRYYLEMASGKYLSPIVFI